jgi:hypothetical protein
MSVILKSKINDKKYTMTPKGNATNNIIPAKRIEREDTVG